MKFTFRIIWASVVAFVIPILSWIMFPELGWKEPVLFMVFVVVLYGGYELRIAWLKKKRK